MDQEWKDFWYSYSRKTGALTWRLALGSDMPAIRRLQNTARRVLGQPQRTTNLFRIPVLVALVAVDKKGKIVDLVYAEAKVEIVKSSCSMVGLEESALLEQDLQPFLRSFGFRDALVSTMPAHVSRMAPILEALGFKNLTGVLSYWRKRL